MKAAKFNIQINKENYGLGHFITTWLEFNSKLLKFNDDADIMEELKGLTPEQLKALIAMVKKS